MELYLFGIFTIWSLLRKHWHVENVRVLANPNAVAEPEILNYSD